MPEYETHILKLKDHPLKLDVDPKRLFVPNATTIRFSRAIKEHSNLEGLIVFDIGTGVGPLAIWAGLERAREVHAVDPVAEHIKFADRNIRRYKLEKIIRTYQGEFFIPLNNGLKADVIIGDISGIPDEVAGKLGWYPSGIPAGGEDGTERITALLNQAPNVLEKKGVLYFPIAIDLSDQQKILDAAGKNFRKVVEASDVFPFPLKEKQIEDMKEAYGGDLPSFITPQKSRERLFWRGQIYKASNPILI